MLVTARSRDRDVDQLVDLILGARSRRCRRSTVPKSRRHPHFAREEMERWIPQSAAAAYRWEPRLGGFRKARPESPKLPAPSVVSRYADYMETGEFANALAQLLAHAKARKPP